MAAMNPNRRSFCTSLAAAAAATAIGTRAWAQQRRERPNILFITGDDEGQQLGCYGDPVARTPHHDRLAAMGVRFQNAYVTQASCSPSRSSMFTGRFPHQNNQLGLSHRGYAMHPGQPTLPALLGAAGYHTGVLGKIHVQPERDLPFAFRNTNTSRTRKVALTAQDASEFWDQSGDRPWFLMVNYFDPHRPLVDQVDNEPPEPFRAGDVPLFDWLPYDTEKTRQEVADYYNCITRMDRGVGLLLDDLERRGQLDQTMIVLIGDHGPCFTRAKTTCYEAGVRIPFLLHWPGQSEAGLVRDELVSTVDILPTMLAAAGVTAPDGLPGASLAPLARRGAAPWRDHLATEFTAHGPTNYFPRRTIRDSQYKLIHNLDPANGKPTTTVDGCSAYQASRDEKYVGTVARAALDLGTRPPRWELYDLSADPVEFHNLANQPAYAATLQRLQNELSAWQETTDDPLRHPETLAALTAQHQQPQPSQQPRQPQQQ